LKLFGLDNPSHHALLDVVGDQAHLQREEEKEREMNKELGKR
jgi:hypothetical protein